MPLLHDARVTASIATPDGRARATFVRLSRPRSKIDGRTLRCRRGRTSVRYSSHLSASTGMSDMAIFEAAFPYCDDILALPVADVDAAARWYALHFGMTEVERRTAPHRSVIMQRDGVRIGFAMNGGDSTQDGAAIRVDDIDAARAEIDATGITIGEGRVDERNGERLHVFFVVAPDGLCYYFHQPITNK
jgi:catechol 2,3-dioxygenase-like lactoylglutathione lyase family enzyme